MKKKKKGFTLTELIAVIVILGVIGLIGIPAYNSIRSRTLETQYENIVSLIETEAAKYAQKNITNLTNVEELIKAGLLETDDGSNIYDPRNKNKLNCYLVEIDYANGQYKSKWLDIEVKDSNGSCDLAAAKAKLGTVGININKKSDNSKVTSGEWVEEDVKLSANLKDVSASDVTGYKWVSGNGYSSKENAITTNVNTILNTTYHLEVRTEDNIYFAEANIKVDKQVPIVKSVEVTPGSDWESGRDIKIVATDQKGSGIAGYYVGTEACDSGVTFEEVKSTKKEVKIDSNIIFEAQQKGIIKYNVCVKDKVGNIGTYGEGIEISVEDAIAPICDWSESGESTEWATKREITVKCIDNESGCDPQYREFTENYNTTTKTATLTRIIKDKAGNETKCSKEVNVYVDKTAPTKPDITNPTNENWTNKPFALTLKSNDNESGIESYQYTYNANATSVGTNHDTYWVKQSNSATTEHITDDFTWERNQAVYWRVCDKLGNCSEVSSTKIMLDKTAPAKPTISNPTNGNWSNKDITLTLSSSDGGSGIESYQYTYNANATSVGTNHDTYWVKQSGSASKTQVTSLFTAERNQNAYWRVCDNAGNCSDKNNTMIKIDKTAPAKPTISNPTNGNWTNEHFALTLSSNDGGSGIESYQYTYSSNPAGVGSNHDAYWVKQIDTASTHISGNFTAERSQLVYWRVCDKVGNCSDKSSTWIKLDQTPPTAPTTMNFSFSDWTAYTDSTWTNKSVYVGRSESSQAPTGSTDPKGAAASAVASGVAKYQISTDGATWEDYSYNWRLAMYGITTDGTHYRYFRAVDNAGNAGPALRKIAKIDQTPPTAPTTMNFSFSDWTAYTDNTWTNQTVYVGRKETELAPTGATDVTSSVAKYQISTDGATWEDYSYNWRLPMYAISENGTHYRYFRAVDNAGNAGPALRKIAKIDKTTPTVTCLATNGCPSGKKNCINHKFDDTYSGIYYYYWANCYVDGKVNSEGFDLRCSYKSAYDRLDYYSTNSCKPPYKGSECEKRYEKDDQSLHAYPIKGILSLSTVATTTRDYKQMQTAFKVCDVAGNCSGITTCTDDGVD